MKRIIIVVIVFLCASLSSAQDKLTLSGDYCITEFSKELIVYQIAYEHTYNIKIDTDTNNEDLILIGISNKLKIDSIGNGFFLINKQYFMNFDSTQMSISGFGLIKNDSIYMYYSSGGSFGYVECICVGTRMTMHNTNNTSLTNAINNNSINKTPILLYRMPKLLEEENSNIIGKYSINIFSKELIGNKKVNEYETNISIVSDSFSRETLILNGFINKIEIEALDTNFFSINQQFLDSTDMYIEGFGLVKNNDIYLYYYTYGVSDTIKAICVGTRKTATSINSTQTTTNAFLYQNTPNPFSSETEIRYFLPENAGNAVLYVFSLNGNIMLTKPLVQTGNGSIVISNSELSAGMYVYTLAIDGVEVDSKRMILTEK